MCFDSNLTDFLKNAPANRILEFDFGSKIAEALKPN